MLYASPREDSGTHARRNDEAFAAAEPEEVGRGEVLVVAGFCWIRAIKPAMLSFAEGVGWT